MGNFQSSAATSHVTKHNDLHDCLTASLEYRCGSSNFQQQNIDIALSCGNETYAHSAANSCARNENGDVCGVAFTQFLVDDTEDVDHECLHSGIELNYCPLQCQNFLQSVKRRLGCCFNFYITNTSTNERYCQLADYRLWNFCSIDYPTECNSGLTLNLSADVQTCTSQQFLKRINEHECMQGKCGPTAYQCHPTE